MLARLAAKRFPHALRAGGLVCLALAAAAFCNHANPLGIPWLPSAGGHVGMPRAFEGRLPEINAARAMHLYQSGEALFVDSRDEKDYAADHVPGAISLPMRTWAQTWPQMKSRLPRDRLLVLYCYGSHCGLSTRQGKALLEEGYARLAVLDYGWAAWTKAGNPTVKHLKGGRV